VPVGAIGFLAVFAVFALVVGIVVARMHVTGAPYRTRDGVVRPRGVQRWWRYGVRRADGSQEWRVMERSQYQARLWAARTSGTYGVVCVWLIGDVRPDGRVTVWTWHNGEATQRRKLNMRDLPEYGLAEWEPTMSERIRMGLDMHGGE
jgi:hypothetical protein